MLSKLRVGVSGCGEDDLVCPTVIGRGRAIVAMSTSSTSSKCSSYKRYSHAREDGRCLSYLGVAIPRGVSVTDTERWRGSFQRYSIEWYSEIWMWGVSSIERQLVEEC
jgi:hypothetical protein